MDLQKLDYTELQVLFQTVVLEWQANNIEIKRVKERECVKYADFVRSRADLRQLAKGNSRLHSKLVQIDLEMQIRVWTGKND